MSCERCSWKPGRTLRELLDQVEADAVNDALAHTGGNKTHAARMLSMPIRTLRNILADWSGIRPRRKKKGIPH
jgi:DNA-binding NtrC family response regulator